MKTCKTCMFWSEMKQPNNTEAGACSYKGPGEMEFRNSYEFCDNYTNGSIPNAVEQKFGLPVMPEQSPATPIQLPSQARDYGMSTKDNLVIQVEYMHKTYSRIRIGGVYKLRRPNTFKVIDADETNQTICVQEINLNGSLGTSEWINIRDWMITSVDSDV